MGIFRRDAVVDTARWAAKLYGAYRRRVPQVSMEALCATMMLTRYGHEAAAQPDGIAERTLAALHALGQHGAVRSVAHLVVLILTAEAGFATREVLTKGLWIERIVFELRRKSVPMELTLGDEAHLRGTISLWVAYQPSVDALHETMNTW